jgi:hypothetical protein
VKPIAHLRKIFFKEALRKGINDDDDLKTIIKPIPIPEMELCSLSDPFPDRACSFSQRPFVPVNECKVVTFFPSVITSAKPI